MGKREDRAKAAAAVIAAILFSALPAFSQVQVDGYFRRDGTYVPPHVRSAPDSTRYNNYGVQGNTNPYTGERGSQRHEYSNPPAIQAPQPIRFPDPYQRRGY